MEMAEGGSVDRHLTLPTHHHVPFLEHMGNDGKQHYTTAYYNLDAILSVGYRVNSVNATAFRRWSNTILKQHLLQGYSINRHLVAHLFSRLLMDKGIIMRSVINNQ